MMNTTSGGGRLQRNRMHASAGRWRTGPVLAFVHECLRMRFRRDALGRARALVFELEVHGGSLPIIIDRQQFGFALPILELRL